MSYGVDSKLLEEFFLESAAKTYAGKGEKIILPDGSKQYLISARELTYVDTYVTNGEFSGGWTRIFMGGKPAWLKQYHGWCKNDEKRVLDFLKHALSAQYERGIFYGSRGPRFLWELESRGVGSLVYENRTQPHSSFTHFGGRERIYQSPAWDTDLFWHRYMGLLLLPRGAE
jgi:hypothetical protein